MAIKGIQDLAIKGASVFCRFDFNVPMSPDGTIGDDTRLRRALPTLKYIIQEGGKCIAASHLGRPKGEKRPELSLRPVAARLGALLGREVAFVPDCVGDAVAEAVSRMVDGDVLLLENLRFYPGETKNDPAFAAQLASLADIYVNDAFGTAHRAHASTVGVPKLLKQKAAGLLMKEELDNLGKALENPPRPVVAIFGGAKVSDKLGILQNFLRSVDAMIIAGGMANTFLAAQGVRVGRSKVEDDMFETARQILADASAAGCKIVLPEDVVAAAAMDGSGDVQIAPVSDIPEELMALDIGPKTVERFVEIIRTAATIIWNGPMGVFETEGFARGTMEVARAVAQSAAFSLVGGGDTIRAVRKAGVEQRISYISTGGGAFMEFLEGKTLPGVEALES
ncbi:MAG: phosphoglycerate kinase [Desulfomonilaceae bacterium]